PDGTKIEVRAPLIQGRKGEFRELFESVRKQGFIRAYVDGALIEVADPPKLNRRQNHNVSVVVDRLVVRADDQGRLTDSIETALKLAEGLVEVVNADTNVVETFSEKYGCPVCGISMPELEPRHFSFNSPFGACAKCGGLGTRRRVSEELVLGDPRISILEGVVLPWGEPSGYLRKVVLPTLAKELHFDLNTPWGKLPAAVKKALLYGTGDRVYKFKLEGERRSDYESKWEGILRNIERRYRESTSDGVRASLEEFMIEQPCQTCGGKRLRPESLSVLVIGASIGDV